jgi:hypothetical protein
MNVPRETILEALLNVISTATISNQPAFVTVSRKFQMWDAVPPGGQPACFLRQVPGKVDQNEPFGLNRWTLKCGIWIYAQYSPASDTTPAVLLNNLIDAVEKALLPSPAFPMQTLGGLVVNCWLNGDVIIDEGLTPGDDQAIAVLPCSILTGV